MWFICRPLIKDIALAGLFEALFYLFLHFVLLVYSFLIHVIGFSKQICFQSFLKLVNVLVILAKYSVTFFLLETQNINKNHIILCSSINNMWGKTRSKLVGPVGKEGVLGGVYSLGCEMQEKPQKT